MCSSLRLSPSTDITMSLGGRAFAAPAPNKHLVAYFTYVKLAAGAFESAAEWVTFLFFYGSTVCIGSNRGVLKHETTLPWAFSL